MVSSAIHPIAENGYGALSYDIFLIPPSTILQKWSQFVDKQGVLVTVLGKFIGALKYCLARMERETRLQPSSSISYLHDWPSVS